MRRKLWGAQFWSPSYFVASTGGVTLDKVRDSIQNHEDRAAVSSNALNDWVFPAVRQMRKPALPRAFETNYLDREKFFRLEETIQLDLSVFVAVRSVNNVLHHLGAEVAAGWNCPWQPFGNRSAH